MNSNRKFLILISISILFIIWGGTQSGKKFQLGSARIISNLQKPLTSTASILDARRENQMLREKLIKISMEREQFQSYVKENKRLTQLLSFKEKSSYLLLCAEVVGISPYPNEGIILINKGRIDGVKKDMICITPHGLLGIVTDVAKDVSYIQTLNNPGFRVSAMDSRTRAVGIIRQKNGLILDNIPIASSINLGDTVITSGLGGVFPKGLFVGVIKDIKKSQDMLFYVARVKAFAPSLVEYVFIITQELPEEVPVSIPTPKEKIKRPIISEKPAIEPIIPEPKIRERMRKP
ncbi:MAG: rod shape-determining protein MreC [bacterium (Candidatus Stahlbacteria) CG08_land_8_20_14_0_20_40_26]|nr:MAG: rod shape-determining protein MreC [bacterium (Candidatus Stahlbacteria) CG08_land_8_20_14_0_20_40_26]